MLVKEDGPYFIFEYLRVFVGVRYAHDTLEPEVIDGAPKWRYSLASLFLCVYCMSVWVAIIFAVLYYVKPFIAVALAVPFALSTGAIVTNRWCDYGES